MKEIMIPKRNAQLITPHPKQIRLLRLGRRRQRSDIPDQLQKRELQINRVGPGDRQALQMESVAGVYIAETTEALENSVLKLVDGEGDGLFRVVEEEDVFGDVLFDVVEVEDEPADWVSHWGYLCRDGLCLVHLARVTAEGSAHLMFGIDVGNGFGCDGV